MVVATNHAGFVNNGLTILEMESLSFRRALKTRSSPREILRSFLSRSSPGNVIHGCSRASLAVIRSHWCVCSIRISRSWEGMGWAQRVEELRATF